MFRGMPQNFPMQRSVGAPTMGGMQSIQPLQPPTPPPRQDNLMNFTRMLGGGNFNNSNFRAQPLPQYQGPQAPTAPPRAPQQGGGFATTGQEFFSNQPRQRLPMQPPQRPQPPMPPQGGGQVTTGREFLRNQPVMPGVRSSLGVGSGQPPQMPQPLMRTQGPTFGQIRQEVGGTPAPFQPIQTDHRARMPTNFSLRDAFEPQPASAQPQGMPPQMRRPRGGGGRNPFRQEFAGASPLSNERALEDFRNKMGNMGSGPGQILLDDLLPKIQFERGQPPQMPQPQVPPQTGASPLPEGFSYTAPPDGMYTSVMPSQGKRYAYGPQGQRVEVDDNRLGGRGGQPTSPGLTVLPPRFGDSAPINSVADNFMGFKQDIYGTMRYGDSFKPLSSGGLTSGQTNFTRYDPVTDTYYGTIGGIAGNMPITRKGSEVSDAFKTNFEASFAQNGGTPPPSGSAGTGTTTTGTGTTTTTGADTTPTTTTGTGTTPTTTTDTGTTPTTGTASGEQPFVTSVDKTETRMDPITQQLLFGLDGQGGFIPGAFEAAERTFFDAQGRPIVVPQEIAGLSPDQLRAAQLARSQVGVQRPFIEEAMGLGRQGLGSLERGLTDQAIFDKEALQEMRRGADFALDQRDLGLMDALGGIAEGRGRAIGAEARLRGDLADQERFQTGATDKYLQQLGQREGLARGAADQFGMDLARTRQHGRRTFDEFGRDVTDALGMRAMAGEGLDRDLARSELMATLGTDRQRRGLGRAEGTLMRGIGGLNTGISEAEGLTRRSTRGFDPRMTERFFDPFEDRVVQQTIEDISEQATKGDIAQRARDIASGGQSAFGSRAKLAAGERAEALGRGLAKEIGALRSRGFGQAQQSALGEFARQRAAESAAASGLSSLAGQRFGGRQALSGARERRSQQELAASRGLSDILSRGATQRFGAGSGFADAASQAAAQKLGAGTAFGDLIGRTAAQQLGAQQQLGQTLGQTGASGFGALSGLGSLIGSGAQQRFAAGTGLGQTLAGLGQASAGARQQAGSTGMGISSNLANLFRGIGGTQAQGGAQLGSAQAGFGSQLAGLGSQLQQAGTSDIGLLQGMGAQAQAQRQRELDAQRAMLLQAQQAPLAQYQALMPFVGMAPTGQTTFRTQFGTPPSALQAGLGVGLSGLGALGNFFNRDRTKD